MIDLHIHSRYSDGCDTPEEIAQAAAKKSVTAVALTDHDTTAGVRDFLLACGKEGITGISGIEIGVQVSMGTLHLLGLGVDPDAEALGQILERLRRSREDRNRRILEKLSELGFSLTWDEVQAIAGNDVVGRPHIALAMIARGWAESVSEVFERFLENGAPAYVGRLKPSPVEAIRLITEAGGVAVVAHPFSWIEDIPELEKALRELKAEGLKGVEVYHSSHSTSDTMELLRISKRVGLIPTGGTDYHGEAVKPSIRLGVGGGEMDISEEILKPLLACMNRSGFVLGKEISV